MKPAQPSLAVWDFTAKAALVAPAAFCCFK
jgi:hypothetical protein